MPAPGTPPNSLFFESTEKTIYCEYSVQFEALLEKESSTWLADITDDAYASVAADRPAIAVAEAMARQKTNVCFVTKGAKLVGVVTLKRFLHNVLRE